MIAKDIPLSLYVHIPWCEKKCPYCDFNSHTLLKSIPEKDYIASLFKDIDEDKNLTSGRKIKTIFFGGGTPSLFSASSIEKIIEYVDKSFGIDSNAEITLESNPSSSEKEKFKNFLKAGVNRISIGAQSFNDSHLEKLGRLHKGEDAISAVKAAKSAGFKNINIDLMHGLPQQSVNEAKNDLTIGINLGINHISWYQLTIEPNTEFYSRPPALPCADELAEIYDSGMTLLAKQDFKQYEVSAFTNNGKMSLHNLNYWSFGDYIGVGAGAHGKITLPDNQIIRTKKIKMPETYMTKPQCRKLSKPIFISELATEFMMNALRLKNGVPIDYFEKRTGRTYEEIEQKLLDLQSKGLIALDKKRLQTSELGYRFLNSILEKF